MLRHFESSSLSGRIVVYEVEIEYSSEKVVFSHQIWGEFGYFNSFMKVLQPHLAYEMFKRMEYIT